MCIPKALFSMAGCDATNPRTCAVSLVLSLIAIASCWDVRPGVADTGIWVIASVIILSVSNEGVPRPYQYAAVALAFAAYYFFIPGRKPPTC
jgi:hypothetical protein